MYHLKGAIQLTKFEQKINSEVMILIKQVKG